MQSLLAYWKPETADDELERGSLLDHAASEQFRRVDVGDHVWIVTVRSGELFLVGRIIVGHVTDQAGAAKLMDTDDLWKSSHHIVAASGTAEPVRDLNISEMAAALRFESKQDRLAVDGGLVSAQQLQTMRILRPESATDLEAALRRAG
jgi:hypothetical protein